MPINAIIGGFIATKTTTTTIRSITNGAGEQERAEGDERGVGCK
jgi:hypothetical protein